MAAIRASVLEDFAWIAGDWTFENSVPATRLSPAYADAGRQRFAIADSWVCAGLPGGRLEQHITFDPFSRKWIYSLTRGSYALLRSDHGWEGDQIAFTGPMIMIGIACQWRMTWTKLSENEFRFVDEEERRRSTLDPCRRVAIQAHT